MIKGLKLRVEVEFIYLRKVGERRVKVMIKFMIVDIEYLKLEGKKVLRKN